MTPQETNKKLGQAVRERRVMLGLSQEALAKACGITFQQIQKYEKGANAMSASRLIELSAVLKVEPEQLLKAGNNGVDPVKPSDRESLELMKAFGRIHTLAMRKRIADLVRSIADGDTAGAAAA